VDTLQRVIGQAGLIFLLVAVVGYGTYYIIKRRRSQAEAPELRRETPTAPDGSA
jgi:hypothetical protein